MRAMVKRRHRSAAPLRVDITKIKCIIPHQANRRIIDAVGDRLNARAPTSFSATLIVTAILPPLR